MYKNIIVIWIYFTPLLCQAQQDANWIFGYQSTNPNDSFMGVQMTFMEDSIGLEKFTIPFSQGPNAVISNSEGELIAYSNSCDIANSEHSIMPNGGGLNPGHVHDHYCEGNLGSYPVSESGLLLSTNDEYIYMLHIALSRSFISDKVYQTTIINNDGAYEVSTKNVPILETDEWGRIGPFSSRIDACRHGNGRDWWVIVPHAHQGHYVGLLTRDGLDKMELQTTGIYTETVYDLGQSVFSPDGTLYGRCDVRSKVHLMDFDRCSGRLSNARSLVLEIPQSEVYPIGMAFSPNSRFLYISTVTRLFQLDFWADDVIASQVLIDEYDGFNPGLAVSFYQMQLGPDGKIYMSCTNGCTYLHVIHDPDQKGKACKFEQRGLRLPVHNAYEVPNIPNFGLGAMSGSGCDSLTSVNNDGGSLGFSVFPNPTSGIFSLRSHRVISHELEVTLTTVSGQQIQVDGDIDDDQVTIDLSGMPSGTYIVTVRSEKETGIYRIFKVTND